MKRYWHTLADSTIKKLISKGTTWGEVQERYKQPDWCGYQDALQGDFGCWSLVGESRHQISEEYCAKCDCYRKVNV